MKYVAFNQPLLLLFKKCLHGSKTKFIFRCHCSTFPICDEVTDFKKDFANRFQSKASLKVLPHITLKAPFKFALADHLQTIEWFKQMPLTVSTFQQELQNFDAFHNKHHPVIFINTVMNVELKNLQKEILLAFGKNYPQEEIGDLEIRYSPHMTVAYRDLHPLMFKEAWKEYQIKKYSATFGVKSIHLLQHDTKKWNTISTFHMQ